VTVSSTGTGVWSPGSCGFSTPGQEKVYSFTPTTNGVHTLQVTSTSSTGYIDYFYKVASGGCNATGWNCIDDVFSPEFINRFDGIVPFHSLDSINILSIARLISDEIINNYIQLHNIHINVSDDFLKQIVTDHYDERYGARDVQRLISAAIEDTIAKKILENEIKSGDNVTL
jgi:hypothetical protein